MHIGDNDGAFADRRSHPLDGAGSYVPGLSRSRPCWLRKACYQILARRP